MGAAFFTRSCSSTERNLTGMMEELEREGLNCYMCAGIPKNPVKYGTTVNPTDSAVHGITACYECIFMNAIESLGDERSLEGRVGHRSIGQGFDCGYCREEMRTIAIDPEKRRKIKELMEKYHLDSSDYATQSINDSYRSFPSMLNYHYSGSRGWDWVHDLFGVDTRSLALAVGISPRDIPESFEPVDRERLSTDWSEDVDWDDCNCVGSSCCDFFLRGFGVLLIFCLIEALVVSVITVAEVLFA